MVPPTDQWEMTTFRGRRTDSLPCKAQCILKLYCTRPYHNVIHLAQYQQNVSTQAWSWSNDVNEILKMKLFTLLQYVITFKRETFHVITKHLTYVIVSAIHFHKKGWVFASQLALNSFSLIEDHQSSTLDVTYYLSHARDMTQQQTAESWCVCAR